MAHRLPARLGCRSRAGENARARDPARAGAAGPDAKFTLEWVSVYTFACLRWTSFRHGNVLFAGDSAHGVSPFGARGANSGVQDAENLAWKLAYVLEGQRRRQPARYLREGERGLRRPTRTSSTRAGSTDFITPKSAASFRAACSAMRCWAWPAATCVCAQPGQQRSAVRRHALRAWLAAQYARRGRPRRQDGARRGLRGCSGFRCTRRWLAARASRRRVLPGWCVRHARQP
ncbi:FAD-dependent monooxygenase [Cupriavidus basilensis]